MDFAFLLLGAGALLALILYAHALARLWVRHVRAHPGSWRIVRACRLPHRDAARPWAVL